MQASFSHVVQAVADETSRELGADDIWTAFEGTHHASEGKRFQIVDWAVSHARGTGGGTDRIFAGKLTIERDERSGPIVNPSRRDKVLQHVLISGAAVTYKQTH